MPVPRRRSSIMGMVTLSKLPMQLLSLLNIHTLFQKTKTLLYWGFAPGVILAGMYMEPRPHWLDLINIWE